LLWEDPHGQYLWLGYRVYTILAMHLVRLAGWGDCWMTQVRIARLLQEGEGGLVEESERECGRR